MWIEVEDQQTLYNLDSIWQIYTEDYFDEVTHKNIYYLILKGPKTSSLGYNTKEDRDTAYRIISNKVIRDEV